MNGDPPVEPRRTNTPHKNVVLARKIQRWIKGVTYHTAIAWVRRINSGNHIHDLSMTGNPIQSDTYTTYKFRCSKCGITDLYFTV